MNLALINGDEVSERKTLVAFAVFGNCLQAKGCKSEYRELRLLEQAPEVLKESPAVNVCSSELELHGLDCP